MRERRDEKAWSERGLGLEIDFIRYTVGVFPKRYTVSSFFGASCRMIEIMLRVVKMAEATGPLFASNPGYRGWVTVRVGGVSWRVTEPSMGSPRRGVFHLEAERAARGDLVAKPPGAGFTRTQVTRRPSTMGFTGRSSLRKSAVLRATSSPRTRRRSAALGPGGEAEVTREARSRLLRLFEGLNVTNAAAALDDGLVDASDNCFAESRSG